MACVSVNHKEMHLWVRKKVREVSQSQSVLYDEGKKKNVFFFFFQIQRRFTDSQTITLQIDNAQMAVEDFKTK